MYSTKIKAAVAISTFTVLLSFLTISPATSHSSLLSEKTSFAATVVTMLPQSDAVIRFDSERFFSQSLPQLLSGTPERFAEMDKIVDQVRTQTGIDLKQFDEVVIGMSARETRPNETEYEPIIAARGKFSSDALVGLVAIASNGKYRQEQIGQRVVYIFSPSEMIQKNKPTGGNFMSDLLGSALETLDREVALTAFDQNTLVLGATSRVRQMLSPGPRVSAEMLAKINSSANTLMSFAIKSPTGMNQYLKLEQDTLGRNLSAVRFISGSIDAANSNVTLSLSARMSTITEATSMKQTLDGFKMFLPGVLASGRSQGNQVLGRALQNLRLTRVGSTVSADLTVPQSEIDVLLKK